MKKTQIKELESVLKIAKKYGVTRLTIPGMSFELKGSGNVVPVSPQLQPQEKAPTDEELLFWSAPQIEEQKGAN